VLVQTTLAQTSPVVHGSASPQGEPLGRDTVVFSKIVTLLE